MYTQQHNLNATVRPVDAPLGSAVSHHGNASESTMATCFRNVTGDVWTIKPNHRSRSQRWRSA